LKVWVITLILASSIGRISPSKNANFVIFLVPFDGL
jgi:hypothetical protein